MLKTMRTLSRAKATPELASRLRSSVARLAEAE
jgi:hypothetical protein